MQAQGAARLNQALYCRPSLAKLSEELWLAQLPLCQLQGLCLLHRGPAAARLGHKCLLCCAGQSSRSSQTSAPPLHQQQTASHPEGTWSLRILSKDLFLFPKDIPEHKQPCMPLVRVGKTVR